MILNGTLARWTYNRIIRSNKKRQLKRIIKYLKIDIRRGLCSSRFDIETEYDYLQIEEAKKYFERRGFKVDIDETRTGHRFMIVKW